MIGNININKIVVSHEVSFGRKDFKYFIGCNNAKKARPLYICLPKMSAYKRDFDETKHMNFWIKDDELLGKYK